MARSHLLSLEDQGGGGGETRHRGRNQNAWAVGDARKWKQAPAARSCRSDPSLVFVVSVCLSGAGAHNSFVVEGLSSVGVFLSSFVGFKKLRGVCSWSRLLFRLCFDPGSVLQSALGFDVWLLEEKGRRGWQSLILRTSFEEGGTRSSC